ncbi:hypothetical protein Tco_0469856 [Tanacetum coccineum]
MEGGVEGERKEEGFGSVSQSKDMVSRLLIFDGSAPAIRSMMAFNTRQFSWHARFVVSLKLASNLDSLAS